MVGRSNRPGVAELVPRYRLVVPFARLQDVGTLARMRACTKCGETKPVDQFPPVRRGEPKLQTWCRKCFAEANARNYRRNHEREKARLLRQSAAHRAENRQRAVEHLRRHPCVDCGETDIVVLQFDHLTGKRLNLSDMISGAWSWLAIELEIAKCEVRCANCHRLKTILGRARTDRSKTRAPRGPQQLILTDALTRTCRVCADCKRMVEFPYRSKLSGTRHWICLSCQRKAARAWYLRRVPGAKRVSGYGVYLRERNAAKVDEYLCAHPCVDCGQSNPALLDFDHLRDKSDDVATMVVNGSVWGVIAAEIAECEVRCANCHARKTAREMGYYRVRLG